MSKKTSFSAVVSIAIISVILFSGQQPRRVAQSQQRQPAPEQQPQLTPPRPATAPSATTQRTIAAPTPAPVAPATSATADFLLPEDIQFPDAPPGASRTITLFGDPRAEGLYVTRTLIPKGSQTIPHFHPETRTVTVLSGICYYGRGEVFDESLTEPLPPGSFFPEPAGVPHFIWAKDGDVIVQTTAIGPSGTQIVPARNPSAGQIR